MLQKNFPQSATGGQVLWIQLLIHGRTPPIASPRAKAYLEVLDALHDVQE